MKKGTTWDGPTKFPVEKMEKLRDDYLERTEALRSEYIEAAANINMEWFFMNYEDPCESTPVDGGEYVFIWGEEDAREVIEEGLETMVPEDLFEAIVDATADLLDGREGGPNCGDVCVPLFGRYDEDEVAQD